MFLNKLNIYKYIFKIWINYIKNHSETSSLNFLIRIRVDLATYAGLVL